MTNMRFIRPALSLAGVLASITGALAGKADVVAVEHRKDTDGSFTFSVTVKSDETGWEKYADRWEVVAPDGTVLGVRVLAHPHVEEQPFTREQSGISIPATVAEVLVRAHDKVEGFGGKEMRIQISP